MKTFWLIMMAVFLVLAVLAANTGHWDRSATLWSAATFALLWIHINYDRKWLN